MNSLVKHEIQPKIAFALFGISYKEKYFSANSHDLNTFTSCTFLKDSFQVFERS